MGGGLNARTGCRVIEDVIETFVGRRGNENGYAM